MVNGSTRAIKKHDRDHEVQRRVREFNDRNHQDWTPCEMYGHDYDADGRCSCGEHREGD